ncbi:MAG: hypothetical protein IPK97_16295 [Ahniella sp.]|nr:hypothetical protein [Ahniella sp.]
MRPWFPGESGYTRPRSWRRTLLPMVLAGWLFAVLATAATPTADPLIAEPAVQVWQIHTDRSGADFEVRALGIIPVRGRFVALVVP